MFKLISLYIYTVRIDLFPNLKLYYRLKTVYWVSRSLVAKPIWNTRINNFFRIFILLSFISLYILYILSQNCELSLLFFRQRFWTLASHLLSRWNCIFQWQMCQYGVRCIICRRQYPIIETLIVNSVGEKILNFSYSLIKFMTYIRLEMCINTNHFSTVSNSSTLRNKQLYRTSSLPPSYCSCV